MTGYKNLGHKQSSLAGKIPSSQAYYPDDEDDASQDSTELAAQHHRVMQEKTAKTNKVLSGAHAKAAQHYEKATEHWGNGKDSQARRSLTLADKLFK